ncbi:hypothetical protein K435DRAFT_791210 [Dendrothele bispora CBS 962.96]|uniref:Uncharacterized protein n=1 Tax=Dendrothele bispora (strain CBS 962.96) TaxID=1314807 RepID=A0A4S8MNR6_DENBC|nr:hypothetical protein K435DRAFT_791210 [Dendrothele bispora CBS 962.96]
MAGVLSVAQAELIGLIVHSCLFGIYIILFAQNLPLAVHSNFVSKIRNTNKFLFTANFLLFIFIFLHWIIQIHRSQKAFISNAGKPGDPATVYYAFPADPMNLLKETLYLTQTFIADCTMIYRLWIVYNKKHYVVIGPIMIMMLFVVSAIGAVIALARTTPEENIFVSTAGRWAAMLFPSTVATNILTTSLITYRVWRIHSQVHSMVISSGPNLLSILHIMIESATLYTTTAILLLIGYMAKSTWQFIVIDMISPIIGISFTLMSVRVNRSGSANASQNTQVVSHNIRTEDIGLGSLPVTISQEVTKDYEGS